MMPARAPAASPLPMCPLSIFSVTLLDLAALMDEIQAIIDRVAMAVEFVFGFALLAGLLVLFAAVHATLDERLRESAVLRTLGAGRGVVARGLAAEFLALGVIAGLLAAVGASGIGFLLARHVFDIAFTFKPRPPRLRHRGGRPRGDGLRAYGDAAGIEQRPARDPAAGVTAIRGRVWVNTWTFASRHGTIAPSSAR